MFGNPFLRPHPPTSGSGSHGPPTVLLGAAVALLCGILFRLYLSRVGIPLTVLQFALGAAFGGIGLVWDVIDKFDDDVQFMDPHLIFFVFLPILIFESAFFCDVHVFERIFWQSCLLAVPGLALATGLTALVMIGMYPDWTLLMALLYGAIVSATDPVAVVALLRELGCSKKLAILVEGESLLNDGTAIVMFTLFRDAVYVGSIEGGPLGVVWTFFKTCALGMLTGFLIGYITVSLLRVTFNDHVAEITMTIIASYATFLIAEGLLHASGVLALVTLGIYLGSNRSSISVEVEHAMHEFWEVLVWIANTLIFTMLGILIVDLIKVSPAAPIDIWRGRAVLLEPLGPTCAASALQFGPPQTHRRDQGVPAESCGAVQRTVSI